jgi:hypothetical protein
MEKLRFFLMPLDELAKDEHKASHFRVPSKGYALTVTLHAQTLLEKDFKLAEFKTVPVPRMSVADQWTENWIGGALRGSEYKPASPISAEDLANAFSPEAVVKQMKGITFTHKTNRV